MKRARKTFYKGIEIANNKELAQYLGITESSIKQWKEKKRLLAKIGLKFKQSIDKNFTESKTKD